VDEWIPASHGAVLMTGRQLSRREFSRLLVAGGVAQTLCGICAARAQTDEPGLIDDIAVSFANPPVSAAPHTYSMWMNGNITREGITLDLEAMHRCGIGGLYIYNCAVGIPRGPVDYGSPEWLALMHHAVSEAARLGLKVAMHNAPGYSGTGGPWMTPELSMQELVWTETLIDAQDADVVPLLRQPRTRAGFYRDIFVLAYPALTSEQGPMSWHLREASANGKPIDKTILWEGNRNRKFRLEALAGGGTGTFDLRFDTPYGAQAISIYRAPEDPVDPFDGPRDYPPAVTLQSSNDGQHYSEVCTFSTPALRSMNSPGVQSFAPVKALYYRLKTSRPTWITGFELHSGPRLAGWAGKANGASMSGGPQPEIAESDCIDPATVLDLSEHLREDGSLDWKPLSGRWTIVRLGHTSTGETVAAAPDSGIGLECDKLCKDAVDFHFTQSLEPLFNVLGSLVGKTLDALLIDSWEAGKQNWTPEFQACFRGRCGYDLKSYVLAMTGRVIGSVSDSNRFLFDVRGTQAQMLAENYYGHFQTRLHALGLQLHAEPYGDGTFESMQIAEYLDLPMGEFWARYTYGSKAYADLTAGAAHTLGKPVAACEAFTGAPLTSRWTSHPYSMKAEGDRMFCLGINRFVFHTFVHQPHPTARPGMTMGPFGTHFDRNETWMQSDTGWIRYLTRAQFLLQSGSSVADICYLKGEEPSSGVPDARLGALAVPPTYSVDMVHKDSLTAAKVVNGKVSFSGVEGYACMILAPLKEATPELLKNLLSLVNRGMVLVTSRKPSDSPSLVGKDNANTEAAALVKQIWGDLDGKERRDRRVGEGRVILTDSLEGVLPSIGLTPDFDYISERAGTDILFLHRRVRGEDMYLVSNQRRRAEQVLCSFRTADAKPELWDAETGIRMGVPGYDSAEGRTRILLKLGPSSSIFVAFRKGAALQPPVSLLSNGVALNSLALQLPKPARDLVDSFSVTVWAQPETYTFPNNSYLALPEDGSAVFGAGHSIAGLAAGQNGVAVYEHSGGTPRMVLQSSAKLSGWTHLALVYRAGMPTLYLDGVEVARGEASSFRVHAPRDCRTPIASPPKYFEGNMTELAIGSALTEDEVRRLAALGLPDPEGNDDVETERRVDGTLRTTGWKPGTYRLQEGIRSRSIVVPSGARRELLNTPWHLTFPIESKVQGAVTMQRLIALNRHDDTDVRYFSGTVSYATTFEAPAREPRTKVSLDLGRLNVTARVKIDGREAGSLWKPPYRLDISKLVQSGKNALEIEVTTLWPNRLIGDEQLPAEDRYDLHGPIKELPEWFKAGQPKPGARETFSAWHHYGKDDPLLDSGLLGPVSVSYGVDLQV